MTMSALSFWTSGIQKAKLTSKNGPNSQVKTVQTHKCTLVEAFGYNRILLFFFALETHIKLTINILFKIPV